MDPENPDPVPFFPGTGGTYDEQTIKIIQVLYIVASLAWIFICIIFELYLVDIWGILILFIPIIIFTINYLNVPYLNSHTEENVNAFNFFSIGLLIVLPLIILVRCSYKGNREKVIEIIVIALIFAVLSILTLWINYAYISVLKHIRSIFQTYSLILLSFALYIYYRYSVRAEGNFIAVDMHPDLQKQHFEARLPKDAENNSPYNPL